MTKTIDKIKLNRNLNMNMDMYMNIIEETKGGAKGGDLAKKYKVSYSTVARVRSHARKAGLLEYTEKQAKAVTTRRARKNQKNFRQKQVERKAQLAAVIPTETAPRKEPEFIKVDFKGTEIHVEKTGKIMITSEGITVR